jgi:hypothetical protein
MDTCILPTIEERSIQNIERIKEARDMHFLSSAEGETH